jgi:hypothetical protein
VLILRLIDRVGFPMLITMDTYDITGLDAQSAKEILFQVIKSLKTTTAQREKLEMELTVWQGRVRLAVENGKSDLQAQAQTRVGDIEFQLDSLRAEEAELVRGVDQMKRQLKLLENQPELSVDAEALLFQLDQIAGERDELADTFREEEGNALLDKLKEDMKDDA